MRDTLTIGRIAGIRFGVSWTWAIVFALIVWTLAGGVFPDTNPGLARSAYVAMALVAALLFFGALLAHELGHALVAQREVIDEPVTNIEIENLVERAMERIGG